MPDELASIRPRLIRRGSVDHVSPPGRSCAASIRPRLIRRGSPRCDERVCCGGGASIRPRLIRRGSKSGWMNATSAAMLQLGRA